MSLDLESRLVVKSQYLRRPVHRPSRRELAVIRNNRIEVARAVKEAARYKPLDFRAAGAPPHAALADYFDGPDLSRYQGASAINGFDFAIFNIEDPSVDAKIATATAQGKPWDIYKWCYSGQSGAYMAGRSKSIVDANFRGGRYPRFWLDYEDSGVQPWQIGDWYNACNNAGVNSGLYIYLYLMNTQGVQFVRNGKIGGWLAYYPGNNSGVYYPSMSDTARARGADGHQYTSTNGTLDQNVFFDPAWYVGGPYVPPVPPSPPINWDDVFTNLRALEGDNKVATCRFLDTDVIDTVDDAGNLLHSARGGPYGVWNPKDQVILAGICNPGKEPSQVVHGSTLAVYVQHRDGHIMSVTWDPDNGWRDTYANKFTPPIG